MQPASGAELEGLAEIAWSSQVNVEVCPGLKLPVGCAGAAPSFSGALPGSYTPAPTPSGAGEFGGFGNGAGALSPLGPAKTAPQNPAPAPG